MNRAYFRFYEELNDFLPPEKRKQTFEYYFELNPSVKDAVEAIGVPHTEIDLIIANGKSVSFDYLISDNDYISVYPVFESLDISNIIHLREKPLRECKFIADSHLGKLARYLRIFGFDTIYEKKIGAEKIIEIALKEKRTILTRSVSLLKNKKITHGYFIRSENPVEQIKQVIRQSDLYKLINPFTICPVCNGQLIETQKNEIINIIPAQTALHHNQFKKCKSCQKIYWQGTHWNKINSLLHEILRNA